MRFPFADVNVTQRHRERICRVGGFWSLRHAQQGSNHLLHLFFAGVPIARDGCFYLAWRITESRHIGLRSGQENHASHFGQAQRGFDVQRGKDRFECHGSRPEFLNQFRDNPMDLTEMSVPCR